MSASREETIKRIALDVGFSLVGIAGISPHDRSNRVYQRWLSEGKHAAMGYLERHAAQRRDPGSLLPGARSAVCVALNYYQEIENEQRLHDGRDGRGVFSIYVHGEDYHGVMDRMLSELERRLADRFPSLSAKACADTMPVSDRELAIRAGIAWLGKNSNVISPQFGSWIFLGELITNLDLEPDKPLETLCGTCSRCIDACPTGALDTPFTLDANKCISYLTIENRGEIPDRLREAIGIDVYGCDTCQSVCPFNDIATQSQVFSREDRSPLVDMTLDELREISDEQFRELTRHSAIRRCKPEGMRRNAEVVRRNLEKGPVEQPASRYPR